MKSFICIYRAVRGVLLCAFLATAVCACVYATIFIRTATRVIKEVPNQISATQEALIQVISDSRHDIDKQLSATRGDLLSTVNMQVGGARSDIRSIGKEALGRTSDALARVDTALATVEALRRDVAPTLANVAALTGHAASVSAHIDDALPMFTDCAIYEGGELVGGNPDCVFNRFQGTSKAAEQMFQAGAKAAPSITKNVDGITSDFKVMTVDAHRWVDDVTKPLTKTEKAIRIAELVGTIGIRAFF